MAICLPCHVERSETSLAIAFPAVYRNDQRFFALLRMTMIGRSASAKAMAHSLQPWLCATLQAKAGAGDEARTRDVLLGKEVLYH